MAGKKPEVEEDEEKDELVIDIVDEAPPEKPLDGEPPPEKPPEKPAEAAAEKPKESPVQLSEEPDEDELKSYSVKVRERINKMAAKTHAERRAKETIQQQLDESVRYARGAIEENRRLKDLIFQGETVWKDTNKGRLEAQIDQARQAYKKAYEEGDAEALSQANADLTALSVELDRTVNWEPQPLPQQQEPVQAPPADKQAEEWQGKNTWFGRDVEMTGFALGVHQRLVNGGTDPRQTAYYEQIDGEMRKRFPERFTQVEATVKPPNGGDTVVAPAGRSSKPPRKVQLTASQVAIAKKLGVPTQEYAEEVLRIQNDERR